MPFPKVKFNNEKRLEPNLSSFIIFGRLIRGRKLDPVTMSRWMRNIDKSDYEGINVEKIREHFLKLSATPRIVNV